MNLIVRSLYDLLSVLYFYNAVFLFLFERRSTKRVFHKKVSMTKNWLMIKNPKFLSNQAYIQVDCLKLIFGVGNLFMGHPLCNQEGWMG